jgi:hypothetical protein
MRDLKRAFRNSSAGFACFAWRAALGNSGTSRHVYVPCSDDTTFALHNGNRLCLGQIR